MVRGRITGPPRPRHRVGAAEPVVAIALDVLVDDLDQAEPKVLALGATRLPGEGASFHVYADPAGHPFCLCTQ